MAADVSEMPDTIIEQQQQQQRGSEANELIDISINRDISLSPRSRIHAYKHTYI